MININDIKQYAERIKSQIPDVKKVFIVVDDSQLSKELSKVAKGDNLLLVGILPSHKITGDNVDQAQPLDHMSWLILNKVTRGDGQDEFLSSMERCQDATRELVKLMLRDKSPDENICGLMRMLQVSSIAVDPVWSLNSCDGYEINYQLKSRLF